MSPGQGFTGRVASIAEAEGVRYSIEDGIIHLEEEDLRVKSFHAKGTINGITFDYAFPEYQMRIDRLYLQSMVAAGTSEFLIPVERREKLIEFYGHRRYIALNGEYKFLEVLIMGLESVSIEWK